MTKQKLPLTFFFFFFFEPLYFIRLCLYTEMTGLVLKHQLHCSRNHMCFRLLEQCSVLANDCMWECVFVMSWEEQKSHSTFSQSTPVSFLLFSGEHNAHWSIQLHGQSCTHSHLLLLRHALMTEHCTERGSGEKHLFWQSAQVKLLSNLWPWWQEMMLFFRLNRSRHKCEATL